MLKTERTKNDKSVAYGVADCIWELPILSGIVVDQNSTAMRKDDPRKES